MKRIIVLLALLPLTGCLEKNKTTTYNNDYVIQQTTEVKCPWGFMDMPTGNFVGPCGQEFHCEVVCTPVGCAVPAPAGIALAGVGAIAVGWIKRKRMI